MKKLTLALLCALSLPLGTINAGFGYYAGRVAQGLTRSALVAIPTMGTAMHSFDYADYDKETEQHFATIQKLNTNLPENTENRFGLASMAQLAKDVSLKTGISDENIAIYIVPGKADDRFQPDNMGILKFKRSADGKPALTIAIGRNTFYEYITNPASTAVTLEHEAAHANNDHIEKLGQFKIVRGLTILSIGAFLATRKINPQTLSTLQLFTRSLTNVGKLAGLASIFKIPARQFEQYQEREADAVALQKTTSIEELHHFKKGFESTRELHAITYGGPISQLLCSHPTPESRIAKVDARIQELQALEAAQETK